MIRCCECTSPDFSHLIEEKMERVEKALEKPGFFFGVSSITGGIEILVGTTVAVYALAVAAFLSVSSRFPYVSEAQKVSWSNCRGIEHSLHLLHNSITMIALGALQAIPFVGNIATFCIYKFAAQEKKFRCVDEEIKVAQTALHSLSQKINKHETGMKDFADSLAAIKTKEKEIAQSLSSLRGNLTKFKKKVIREREEEVTELHEKLSKTKDRISFLRTSLDGRVDQVSTQLERFHSLRSPLGTYT